MNKYIEDHKNGIVNNPLLIYPEGCVHNGEQIVQFKMGAFANLCPIMPFSIKFERPWGTSPDMVGIDVKLVYYLCCCSPPWGTIHHVMYPTFKPNQFLWDNHMRDGEDKAKCYMRVMRQIMIKETGLIDSSTMAIN